MCDEKHVVPPRIACRNCCTPDITEGNYKSGSDEREGIHEKHSISLEWCESTVDGNSTKWACAAFSFTILYELWGSNWSVNCDPGICSSILYSVLDHIYSWSRPCTVVGDAQTACKHHGSLSEFRQMSRSTPQWPHECAIINAWSSTFNETRSWTSPHMKRIVSRARIGNMVDPVWGSHGY